MIEEAAKANGRSMNAEIAQRLESSFEPPVVHDSFKGALDYVISTALDAGIIEVTNITPEQARENVAKAKRIRDLVATGKASR